MKNIRIFYAKCDNVVANFGDVLAPFIIESLSGRKTKYCEPLPTTIDSIKRVILSIYRNDIDFKYSVKTFVKCLTNINTKVLYSVGSILGWGQDRSKCYYWGSGFINSTSGFCGGKVYATRGPKSQERLTKLGYESCDAYGDPALLLPLLVKGSDKKKYKISIVPHYENYEYIQSKFGDVYNVIKLNTDDIAHVISEITSSDYILSTSLHGIIVSHAYNIPALWIQHNRLKAGDGFKFADYFSSVEIKEYMGISDFEDSILSKEEDEIIAYLNDSYSNVILPKRATITRIQSMLFGSAPFPLLSKYKDIIESNKF